jgi:drug/metabolite transporter (DMT)-like permease
MGPKMETNHEAFEVQEGPSVVAQTNNRHGVAGLVLGVIGYFLYEVGLLPILAIVFSGIGLGTHDPSQHKNRWMSVVGLISGIIGTFLYLYAYGHLE